MPSKSSKKVVANDAYLLEFTKLFLVAANLIQKQLRSEQSCQALLQSLQLFQEDRLDLESNLDDVMQFRKDLKQFGQIYVFDALLAEIPHRAANVIRYSLNMMHNDNRPLEALLSISEYRLKGFRGIGITGLSKIKHALQRRGLHLGMTSTEIKQIFE